MFASATPQRSGAAAYSTGWSVTAISPTRIPSTGTTAAERAASGPNPAPAVGDARRPEQLERVLERLLAEVERVVVGQPDGTDVHRLQRVDGSGRAAEEERLAFDQCGRPAARGDAAFEVAHHQVQRSCQFPELRGP